MSADTPLILVVDDNEMNRDMLSRRLERHNYRSVVAEDGVQALELLRAQRFDLVLMDIMMPRMNGYQLLETIKHDPALRHIPVIMISAVDDLDSVVKCVEMGAEDYLFKPFNPILLRARINASLEKKRLYDQEQRLLAGGLLPPLVADRLQNGQPTAEWFAEATALVAGVAGLHDVPPDEAARALDGLFAVFDRLAARHGLYGVTTPTSVYLAVGGAPAHRHDHAEAVAALALDMLAEAGARGLMLNIGLHTGPLAGGVFESRGAPRYHLWGDALEGAERLRLIAPAGGALASAAAVERLREGIAVEAVEPPGGLFLLKAPGG